MSHTDHFDPDEHPREARGRFVQKRNSDPEAALPDPADFTDARNAGREDARNGLEPNPPFTDPDLEEAYLGAYFEEQAELDLVG